MFAPGQMIHGGKAGSTHQAYPSIDDLGAEWPSFAESADFPVFEVKVDREFITGCADDCLKQMICRRILHLADIVGARTLAEVCARWASIWFKAFCSRSQCQRSNSREPC
jgi:hypothetical protein